MADLRISTILGIVSVLLLAGCTQPAPNVASNPDVPAVVKERPTKLDPIQLLPEVKLGKGAGEPNIAFAPDGTVYVTPITKVFRSTDGAKSFEDLGGSQTKGHGDGDIVVTPSGRLHWLGLGGGIPYQYSDDQGRTFSKAVDLSNKTGRDREWIDARPEGTLYASWRGTVDGKGVISTRTSFDEGATWGPMRTMSPDAVGGPIIHGPKNGEVYEAMTTFATGTPATSGGKIVLARSSDHGANWTFTTVFEPPQSAQVGLIGFATSIFPVAAADSDGTLYVVFSADQRLLPTAVPKPASRYGVFLTVSHDEGATWTKPQLLSDAGHAAVMPWVAAGATGRIAVTWYENVYGLPNDALPDLWNVKMFESVTADKPKVEGTTVQLNGQPNHIGPVCTNGSGCLASDRSLLDFFEVAIGPNGQPAATWSFSVAGTGVGVAAQGTEIFARAVLTGTPLV